MALTLGECGRVVLMVSVRLLLLVSPPRRRSPPSTCLRSSVRRCTTDPNRPVRFQSIPIFFTMSKVWLLADSVLNDPPPQESDLPPDPELDSRLPQHEFNSEFCATKNYRKLSCVHGHTPARRVCTEGFDIGRRFLSCPLEVSAKFIILLQLMPPLIQNTI